MPKSARYHIDRANSIVFIPQKRLPLQPVSSERNDDSSRMKQAVVATFLRLKTILYIYIYIYIVYMSIYILIKRRKIKNVN